MLSLVTSTEVCCNFARKNLPKIVTFRYFSQMLSVVASAGKDPAEQSQVDAADVRLRRVRCGKKSVLPNSQSEAISGSFGWRSKKKRKTWRERRVSHPLRPPYAEKRKEAKVVEPKKCSNEAWKASARSELNCLRQRVRFPFINGLVSVSVHMSMSWVQLCLIDSVS